MGIKRIEKARKGEIRGQVCEKISETRMRRFEQNQNNFIYVSLTCGENIGVNISERKSGTERTKKRKKRELVFFSTARGRNVVHHL